MKTWKEVPHLFANGKFKIKESKFHPDKVYEIEGHNSTFKGGCFLYNEGCLINTKYCTLIARKIEDMTDEECENCPTYKPNNITPIEAFKYRLSFWVNYYPNELPAVVQNYLLSVGVYPFDQNDFEAGEVLDIKQLTK